MIVESRAAIETHADVEFQALVDWIPMIGLSDSHRSITEQSLALF
jgi:hypothetical protein